MLHFEVQSTLYKIDPHLATPFRPRLAQLFEEEQFGGSELYLKHFAGVKKKYPYIGVLFDELKAEARSEDPNPQKVAADDFANKVAKQVFQQLSQAVGRLVGTAAFAYLAVATLKWLIDGGWLTVLQVVAFIFSLFSGRH